MVVVVVVCLQTEDLIVNLASATWLYSLRYLPHLLLAHKVLEVVKEANDAFVPFEWISAEKERIKKYVRALQAIYVVAITITHHFLKRFILTIMLYCCQRLEKLITPLDI